MNKKEGKEIAGKEEKEKVGKEGKERVGKEGTSVNVTNNKRTSE